MKLNERDKKILLNALRHYLGKTLRVDKAADVMRLMKRIEGKEDIQNKLRNHPDFVKDFENIGALIFS
ncbi:hypothetical protein KJ756_00990 [Patescibacteria group bacterium]|nr:hypothetical protein [Patescibacteria group bacterium]MBU4082400.1 hypothetical protein [Patescibacteria group bacterium]MCG2809341.1 hypothetical protein [Candidatus Portnoybacteria bacterium]